MGYAVRDSRIVSLLEEYHHTPLQGKRVKNKKDRNKISRKIPTFTETDSWQQS